MSCLFGVGRALCFVFDSSGGRVCASIPPRRHFKSHPTSAPTPTHSNPNSDEVRRAFHLGDKDGVPQSPPRKGGRESLPRPTYRRFFRPQPLSEEEEVALRQKELEEEQRRPPLPPPVVQAQQPLSLPLVQEQQLPPAKRAKAEAAPAPAVPAVAPAPAAVAVPGLALAVEAPQVDVSQLAGMRRRVSELTQPEVLTVRFAGWSRVARVES